MKKYGSFHEAIKATKFEIYKRSEIVAPLTWQSVDVSKRPEMVTHEVQWWGFRVNVADVIVGNDLTLAQEQIEPNLPWADDHFEERVCGQPLNPGLQWAQWPWATSAEKFQKDGMFNHTYAERYWPKNANMLDANVTAEEIFDKFTDISHNLPVHRGIRYEYGDLQDVVAQMIKDPLTRQAILPIFFPEDTGAVHGERVPCSIFYQFMIRNGKLDIFYYLRSCDFVRHFRDDIYLTLRLQLWMVNLLKMNGVDVEPGNFLMQMGSLHIFRNDWLPLFNEPPKDIK
jgi:hypothetical protein